MVAGSPARPAARSPRCVRGPARRGSGPAGRRSTGGAAPAPSQKASTVGPGAGDDRRHAVGAQRARPARATRASRARGSPGAGSPRVAASSCSGWPASAATSSAARPALAAASACGTAPAAARGPPRSTPASGGTKTTARDPGVDARRGRRRPAVAVAPGDRRSRRERRARRCRGGPRARRRARSSASSSSSSGPAGDQRPGQRDARRRSPPTTSPRPRACGIALRQVSRRPGGCGAHRVEGGAHRPRRPGATRRGARRRRPRPSTSTTERRRRSTSAVELVAQRRARARGSRSPGRGWRRWPGR